MNTQCGRKPRQDSMKIARAVLLGDLGTLGGCGAQPATQGRLLGNGSALLPHDSAISGTALPNPDTDSADADKLFRELYVELRRMASGYMRGHSPAHTLQTTALIGEVYLKLARAQDSKWSSRPHFMSIASKAMRCVLVDHARRRLADKRRAPGRRIHLDGLLNTFERRSADILDLDEALTSLEALGGTAERAVRVVELRFLSGLTWPEIAAALETPQRTVERDWEFARAWLATRLK